MYNQNDNLNQNINNNNNNNQNYNIYINELNESEQIQKPFRPPPLNLNIIDVNLNQNNNYVNDNNLLNTLNQQQTQQQFQPQSQNPERFSQMFNNEVLKKKQLQDPNLLRMKKLRDEQQQQVINQLNTMNNSLNSNN